MSESFLSVIGKLCTEYGKTTPKKLMIIDAYLVQIFLTGVIQFIYCCLVGTFPFNSFLSGFISCVGSFVLGGKLSQHFYMLLQFCFKSRLCDYQSFWQAAYSCTRCCHHLGFKECMVCQGEVGDYPFDGKRVNLWRIFLVNITMELIVLATCPIFQQVY